MSLGLAGVVLGMPHDADFSIMALLGVSLFGLSGGTLYLKRFAADVPPFEATAVQLIGGALMALLLVIFFETPHVHWSPTLIGAMTWNVLLMSIGGMAIYNLMMDRHGAAKAASGFFIVPGASALIAWLLIDEHLKPIAMIGLAAATIGVALVWWKPKAPLERLFDEPEAARQPHVDFRHVGDEQQHHEHAGEQRQQWRDDLLHRDAARP